jgi:hypothetical protein
MMIDWPGLVKDADEWDYGAGKGQAGKGVRYQKCEAPFGPFRFLVPDPFSGPVTFIHSQITTAQAERMDAQCSDVMFEIVGCFRVSS